MLNYRLRLWAPTSTSRAISAVAELLVCVLCRDILEGLYTDKLKSSATLHEYIMLLPH